MSEKIAELIEENLAGFKGSAALFLCDPPHEGNQYVIASSVDSPVWGKETLLFPATSDGRVLRWSALAGSLEGSLSYVDAWAEAGYSVEVSQTPSRFDLFSPERYIKHCGLLSYEERIRQFQQNVLRVMPVEDGDIND